MRSLESFFTIGYRGLGACLLAFATHCAASAPPIAAPPQAAKAPEGAPINRAATPSCPAPEAAPAATTAASVPRRAAADAGWDQQLTGYPYPYEVKYLALVVQDMPLCMAYMDESPKAPNGQSVLLLHGKNFSGAYWQPTAARLLELGYRVIMPDQIGFGKSSKPTSIQYSFDRLALETARLLDHLSVQGAVVIGHSMGGMLATRFASAYPARVGKLVLVNPIGLEDYRHLVPYLGVDAWRAQAAKQTLEGVQKYMRDNYFHGTWRPEYDQLLEIQGGWARGPDRERMAMVSALTQDMLYTQPVVYDFPKIKAPTLLVIGQLDRTAPGKNDVPEAEARALGNYPRLGEQAESALPRSRLVKLDHVGHVPQYEDFEGWMAALEPFLSAP